MERALNLLKQIRDMDYDDFLALEYSYFDDMVNKSIAEVEAMQERIKELETPKTCEGCKWELETNLITTKVGDKVDICTLCIRYENLQDNYEPKDNA